MSETFDQLRSGEKDIGDSKDHMALVLGIG